MNKLAIAGLMLLLCLSCELDTKQVTGIYAGNIADASDVTVETWLQLYSNNTFHQREIRYVLPIQTKFREGRWRLDRNTIILAINGEKDIRLKWEHGFLRNESASAAHPQLELDMVSLQRISQ